MDWQEHGEDDWFDKYLPGQDLSNSLEWTPFNVDLTTDSSNITATQCMYSGLQRGLQDALRSVGCSHLEALITHRAFQIDDDSCEPGLDDPSPELIPELGIYPNSRSNLAMLRSAAASLIHTDLGLARYSEVDVLIEARRAATFNLTAPLPAYSPPSVISSGTTLSLNDISHFELNLDGARDSLDEPVIEVFDRQHRLFVFMILFVEDKARLLRFDRVGVSMTPEFDYTHRPEVIGKFLHRLSDSCNRHAAMGHDPTVARANEADSDLFRDLHTRYHAASVVGRGLRDAGVEGWPIYKLTVEGSFTPDESRAVRPDDPIGRREFLVGKPMSTRESLHGRGTKVYVAYDVATKKIVVIKDSWRSSSDAIRSEYDTYLLLNSAERPAGEPLLIPTLLGGGDVVWNGEAQQTDCTPNPDPDLRPTRTHFRLVLKEVCRPLEDFTNSLELVIAILCAIDAHSVAWLSARILHRDVSTGNILILDDDPEGPPNPKTVRGLLADWDLARTREELEDPACRHNTRSGTWPFISARLQHTGPEQHHELSDDLESFVHVLNYCAVKYLPNDLSHDDFTVASFISNVYNYVRPTTGGVDTGSIDKLRRLIQNKPFVELQNSIERPLSSLLQTLSKLCFYHYHHIQFRLPHLHHEMGPEKVSIERGRFSRMNISALTAKPHPPQYDPDPRTDRASASVTTALALPLPDPSKSPFNDHDAIARAFLHPLEPPNSKHPAYGLGWPVADKIRRVKPLTSSESAFGVSECQNGFPPYAPFRVPNPEHSTPAKRT